MSKVNWQWNCIYERSIAKAACDKDKLLAIKLALEASNKRVNDVLINELNKRERLLGALKEMKKGVYDERAKDKV